MSEPEQSHRVKQDPPVRAITYTSDDKSQPANAETDPHAAAPVAVQAKPSRKNAAKE